MNRSRRCGVYTTEYYSATREEKNPAICDDMDKLWGHYATWNKLDTERQILFDLNLHMESKKN